MNKLLAHTQAESQINGKGATLMDLPHELHVDIIQQIINDYVALPKRRVRHYLPTIVNLGAVDRHWRALCRPYLFERLSFCKLWHANFAPPEAALAVCRVLDCSDFDHRNKNFFDEASRKSLMVEFATLLTNLPRLDEVHFSKAALDMDVEEYLSSRIKHSVWLGNFCPATLERDPPFQSLRFEECLPPTTVHTEHLILDDWFPGAGRVDFPKVVVKLLDLRSCSLPNPVFAWTLREYGASITTLTIYACELQGASETMSPSSFPHLKHLTVRHLQRHSANLILDFFAPSTTIQTLVAQAIGPVPFPSPNRNLKGICPDPAQMASLLRSGGLSGLKKLEVRFDAQKGPGETLDTMPLTEGGLRSLRAICRARGLKYELRMWREGFIEMTEEDF